MKPLETARRMGARSNWARSSFTARPARPRRRATVSGWLLCDCYDYYVMTMRPARPRRRATVSGWLLC